MHQKVQYLLLQALSAAALTSTPSIACSLASQESIALKQAMATEIAHRLGVNVQKIRLDDITEPVLLTPLELQADCSGLGAYHHISGFKITLDAQSKIKRIGLGNDNSINPAAGADDRWRKRRGYKTGWPADMQAQADYLASYAGGGGIQGRWPEYPTQEAFNASAHASTAVGQPRDPFKGQFNNSKAGSAAGSIRWPEYPTEEDSYAAAGAYGYGQEAAPVIWPGGPWGWGGWGPWGQGTGLVQPGFLHWQMPALSSPAAADKKVCVYEGVADILGYSASSPVAVNFTRSCT